MRFVMKEGLARILTRVSDKASASFSRSRVSIPRRKINDNVKKEFFSSRRDGADISACEDRASLRRFHLGLVLSYYETLFVPTDRYNKICWKPFKFSSRFFSRFLKPSQPDRYTNTSIFIRSIFKHQYLFITSKFERFSGNDYHRKELFGII